MRELLDEVLRGGDLFAGVEELVKEWTAFNDRPVERVARAFGEIRSGGTFDLTTLSVAQRQPSRNLVLTTPLPLAERPLPGSGDPAEATRQRRPGSGDAVGGRHQQVLVLGQEGVESRARRGCRGPGDQGRPSGREVAVDVAALAGGAFSSPGTCCPWHRPGEVGG